MNIFHTYFDNVIERGIKSIQAYFTLFLLTSTCSRWQRRNHQMFHTQTSTLLHVVRKLHLDLLSIPFQH